VKKKRQLAEDRMGLDQYAYVATKQGQQRDYWDGAELDPQTKDYINPKVSKPREIAYWRKHPNLQGWMEQLAESKQLEYDTFNGVELELTIEDLNNLEEAVRSRCLPSTQGFFFGNNSDEYYREQDLQFIREARAELVLGLRVFYNSSW
jgi:hypothetical protein